MTSILIFEDWVWHGKSSHPSLPLKEDVKYAPCPLKYIRVLGPSMSKRGGLGGLDWLQVYMELGKQYI
jgi:hypothetical protein